MGKSNTSKTLRPLARATEYALVGGGAAKQHAENILAERLSNDPVFAARVGVVVKRANDDFARAYPNETRHKVISNSMLRKKGFESLAKTNELLKLLGS